MKRMFALSSFNAIASLLFELLLAGAISVPAHAQNVTFAGVQTTVPATGLICPRGVSVDKAGDVFIANSNDFRIVEVPAGGGAQFDVGTGLKGPNGVTVDGAGDIFIADSLNNRVVEIPADGSPQFTVADGLANPGGVGVDKAGDVFIADTGHNLVLEVPADGGPQTTFGDKLEGPRDVASDRAGDVFVADTYHNRVVEVPASGGAQRTLPTNGLNKPSGVALDSAGDLFISDLGNSRVVEFPAGGGAQSILPASGLTNPYGVAVDGTGNIFIVNFGSNLSRCPLPGEPLSTFKVVELELEAVSFRNVAINSSSTLTANYNVGATTTFGAIELVSGGQPSADFTVGSGSTCTGTVQAGNSCRVNINFAPIAYGKRTAALEVNNSSSNLLVSTPVNGVSVGTTATTLSSSPNPSVEGEAVTFAAVVTPTPPDGEPIRFVHRFAHKTTVLGTGSLTSGTASFTISTLGASGWSTEALYAGDSNLLGSTSNTIEQVVKK